MTAPLLFKVLSAEHKSVYQNFDYKPYLPKKATPGKYLPKVTKLSLCNSGWHFTVRPELHWRVGAELYIAEIRGKVVMESGDKLTAESGRLVERITHEWQWLSLYPVIRALLVSSWHAQNPKAEKAPDWADLSRAYLSRANLSRANLSGAYLSGAYLS